MLNYGKISQNSHCIQLQAGVQIEETNPSVVTQEPRVLPSRAFFIRRASPPRASITSGDRSQRNACWETVSSRFAIAHLSACPLPLATAAHKAVRGSEKCHPAVHPKSGEWILMDNWSSMIPWGTHLELWCRSCLYWVFTVRQALCLELDRDMIEQHLG